MRTLVVLFLGFHGEYGQWEHSDVLSNEPKSILFDSYECSLDPVEFRGMDQGAPPLACNLGQCCS
ncbi:MAG TPA: hypothetical protein VFK05_29620 [Polyangiaceae bacterium]|nr:hypothetical protein [Polyangiaceae bacterium]